MSVLAEVVLPTQELRDDLPFYTKVLGMQLDEIYPADDPTNARLSGHGLAVRIVNNAGSQRLYGEREVFIQN